jgi:hypothetical protein
MEPVQFKWVPKSSLFKKVISLCEVFNMPTLVSNATIPIHGVKKVPNRAGHFAVPYSTVPQPRHGATTLSLTYGSFIPFHTFLTAAGHVTGAATAEAMLKQMGLMEKEIHGIAHRTELLQNGPYNAAKTFLEAANVLPEGSEDQKKRFEWAEKEFVRAAGQIPPGIYQSRCFTAAETCAEHLKQADLVQKYRDDAKQALKKGYSMANTKESKMYESLEEPIFLAGATILSLGVAFAGPFLVVKGAVGFVLTRKGSIQEEYEKLFGPAFDKLDNWKPLVLEANTKERREIVGYASTLTGQAKLEWLTELQAELRENNNCSSYLLGAVDADLQHFQKSLPPQK